MSSNNNSIILKNYIDNESSALVIYMGDDDEAKKIYELFTKDIYNEDNIKNSIYEITSIYKNMVWKRFLKQSIIHMDHF